LAAVLLKLGAYGYIRFCMGLLVAWPGCPAATLAGVAIGGGIVYRGARGLEARRREATRCVLSVAHMGFVMLGLFAGTQQAWKARAADAHLASRPARCSFGRRDLRPPAPRLIREFGGIAR